MACDITSGITNDCLDGAGGVKRMFILNGPAESFSETTGNITDIVVGGSSVVAADWFEFELPRATSSYSEVATADVQQGTLTFQKDLTAVFNKMTVAKRNALLLVAKSNKMIVAFEDENGTYWAFGLSKPAHITTNTANSGVALQDRNGYELVISTMEIEPAYTIDSSIVVA